MGQIREDAIEARAEIQRDAIVRSFLREVGARCCWQQAIKGVGLLELWIANGRAFVLLRYVEGGFEIYISASESNRTQVTLDAVRAYVRGEK